MWTEKPIYVLWRKHQKNNIILLHTQQTQTNKQKKKKPYQTCLFLVPFIVNQNKYTSHFIFYNSYNYSMYIEHFFFWTYVTHIHTPIFYISYKYSMYIEHFLFEHMGHVCIHQYIFWFYKLPSNFIYLWNSRK